MVIRWSLLAKKSLMDIYQFYAPQTGNKKALAIIKEIRQEARLLIDFPNLGTIVYREGQNTIYRYIVKRHCKIFYSIYDDYIWVELVWDTRRDPSLLDKLLK